MRVVGIDPGLARLGWALVESDGNRLREIGHGTVKTGSGVPVEQRLMHIYDSLKKILADFQPAGMAVESVFFVRNVTSAIPVAQARGVVILAAAHAGIEVREYSPLVIKQSVVGVGAAGKSQVQEMVKLILGLRELPGSDHASDALAAAITFLHDGSSCLTVSAAV